MPDGVPIAIGISMGNADVTGCLLHNEFTLVYFGADHVELPCFVAFTDTDILMGRKAMDQMVENPANTIYDIKRLLGRFYDDPEIQDYLKEWPFKVIDCKNRPKYQVRHLGENKTFYPEEIMALFFKTVKEHAEYHLCRAVTETVITIPAQYNCVQRQSTIDAANLAGLHVLQLMAKPMAAAVVHGCIMNRQVANEGVAGGDKNMAVISVGSGFIDVSLLTYSERVFECKSTKGSSALDVNRTLIHHFAPKILDKHGVDVFTDKAAYLRLWKACEKAKRHLKLERECRIVVESITPFADFEAELTRDDLDEMLSGLKKNIRELIDKCLADLEWTPSSVNECLMLGGAMELHCLQDVANDMETYTEGTGVIHYPQFRDVIGAGFRVASMKGAPDFGLQDLIVLEVSSRTVGVSTREGKMRHLVGRNVGIPHWITQEYTTHADNEGTFYIDVLDGDNLIASHNKLLGKYSISGFPRRKRGVVQIRVTLHIDPMGLLTVKAVDRTPGTEEAEVTVRNETCCILYPDEMSQIAQTFHENFPPYQVPPPPFIPQAIPQQPQPEADAAQPVPQVPADVGGAVDVEGQPEVVQHQVDQQDQIQNQNQNQNENQNQNQNQNVPFLPPAGELMLQGHPAGNGNLVVKGKGKEGDGGGCLIIAMMNHQVVGI